MYLLDTDILSHIMRPRPDERLMRRLRRTPRVLQFTSAVNLAELLFGVERCGSIGLRNRVQQILARLPVLPFDEQSARVFGPLKADLERKGTPLAEADMRIASIALANRLALVTGNERHFTRVPGLVVENWLV